MPSCGVIGCSNRLLRDVGITFFSIPSIQTRQRVVEEERIERRARWIAALHRPDLTESKIKNLRVCSAHFLTGRPSEDPEHPDYVPSENMSYGQSSKKPDAKVQRFNRIQKRRKKESTALVLDSRSKFSTFMSVNPVLEVKPEPEMEIYNIESLPHCTALYNHNVQEPEIVEKNLPFPKESVVHLENLKVIEKDGQNILKECLNYSMGNAENKMNISEILPECEDIVSNPKGPLVKIETSHVINGPEKVYDLSFKERIIKNEDIHIKEECLEPHETRNLEVMIKLSTSISVNPVPEVKPEPETEIYEIEKLPHFTPLCNHNAQEPDIVEKNIPFPKESLVHLENLKNGQYILKECLDYSMGNTEIKMGLSEILPGCEDIVPIRKEPVVKIENSDVINKSEKGDDLNFKEWKIKNEDIHIKEEECLEPHETSMPPYFCGQEKQVVTMFSCDQCDYQAVQKRNLTRHLLRHKNPEEVRMFKCVQCDFQTKRQQSLKLHLFQHKKPEEIKMFKCDKCDFQTIFKVYLRRHLRRHEKVKKVNMIQCDQCNYETKEKRLLTRHLLRHMNPEEIDMFKCDQCDYQAIQKSNLKTHLIKHEKTKKS